MRTLWPRTDADRAHRRLVALAFPNQSRPIAFALQLVLWLRWVLVDAWRASISGWVSVRSRRGVAAAGWRDLARSLVWAVVYGVPPGSIRRLGLDPNVPIDGALAHVFEAEAQQFHLLRGDDERAARAGRALLADKDATAALLLSNGLPGVETIGRWAPGEAHRHDDLIPDRPPAASDGLVYKPNRAHGGRGFLRTDPDSPDVVCDLQGAPIGGSLLDAVRDLHARGDIVIAQRHISTHPALADLGTSMHEALVIRIITTSRTGEITSTAAFAEVPTGNGFVMVPVDKHGRLTEPVPAHDLLLEPPSSALNTTGRAVPDWVRLVTAVRNAHALDPLRNVRAIAWDVIPGVDGPVILEGNGAWSLTLLQRVHGPLLGDPAVSAEILADHR